MEAFGARIAARLRPGDVVALTRRPGAGKTTLARAIIAALGHPGEVPSPTFTIVETYDALDPPLVHADFYRLESPARGAKSWGSTIIATVPRCLPNGPNSAGGFAHEPACLSIALEIADDGRKADCRRRRGLARAHAMSDRLPDGLDEFSPRRLGRGARSSRWPAMPSSAAISAFAATAAARC